MEIILLTLLVTLFIAIFVLAHFMHRKITALEKNGNDDKSMMMLNQNIQGMQERIDKTTEAISNRLDKAATVISGVNKELGMVQEMGRQMKDLQDFLRSPKLRGNIGEQVLKDLLEQAFSRKHFSLQHKFKDGQMVDALVKTDKGHIPIDAKFPLENFQKAMRADTEEEKARAFKDFYRDVKKHIKDISKKYILPAEGTVNFAIMYIPSEAVYYEIIRSDAELNAYAHEKKIFPVSPNSFYYFLKVIMLGMEGKKIEEASKRILETLNAISKDAEKFGDVLGVLNTHVSNSKSAIDRVNTEFGKLSGKIDQVKLLK